MGFHCLRALNFMIEVSLVRIHFHEKLQGYAITKKTLVAIVKVDGKV